MKKIGIKLTMIIALTLTLLLSVFVLTGCSEGEDSKMVGITASFENPAMPVAYNATLESILPRVRIIANYDDETTVEVAPTLTMLSGTLISGTTATITATVGEFFDTFTVIVSAEPCAYCSDSGDCCNECTPCIFIQGARTYQRTPATCIAQATYYRICDICGDRAPQGTIHWFHYGEALGHDASNCGDICSRENCTHIYVCGVCTACTVLTLNAAFTYSGNTANLRDLFDDGVLNWFFAERIVNGIVDSIEIGTKIEVDDEIEIIWHLSFGYSVEVFNNGIRINASFCQDNLDHWFHIVVVGGHGVNLEFVITKVANPTIRVDVIDDYDTNFFLHGIFRATGFSEGYVMTFVPIEYDIVVEGIDWSGALGIIWHLNLGYHVIININGTNYERIGAGRIWKELPLAWTYVEITIIITPPLNPAMTSEQITRVEDILASLWFNGTPWEEYTPLYLAAMHHSGVIFPNHSYHTIQVNLDIDMVWPQNWVRYFSTDEEALAFYQARKFFHPVFEQYLTWDEIGFIGFHYGHIVVFGQPQAVNIMLPHLRTHGFLPPLTSTDTI